MALAAQVPDPCLSATSAPPAGFARRSYSTVAAHFATSLTWLNWDQSVSLARSTVTPRSAKAPPRPHFCTRRSTSFSAK